MIDSKIILKIKYKIDNKPNDEKGQDRENNEKQLYGFIASHDFLFLKPQTKMSMNRYFQQNSS